MLNSVDWQSIAYYIWPWISGLSHGYIPNNWHNNSVVRMRSELQVILRCEVSKEQYDCILSHGFQNSVLKPKITAEIKRLDTYYNFIPQPMSFEDIQANHVIGFLDGSAYQGQTAAYAAVVLDHNYNHLLDLSARVSGPQNNYRAETLAALHFFEATKRVPLVEAWVDCYPSKEC